MTHKDIWILDLHSPTVAKLINAGLSSRCTDSSEFYIRNIKKKVAYFYETLSNSLYGFILL